jgi:hypothetical protein
MYDPQTARWLTQDPLAEKMYSLTPSRYGLQGYLSIKVKDREKRALQYQSLHPSFKHTTISFQKKIVSLFNNN